MVEGKGAERGQTSYQTAQVLSLSVHYSGLEEDGDSDMME